MFLLAAATAAATPSASAAAAPSIWAALLLIAAGAALAWVGAFITHWFAGRREVSNRAAALVEQRRKERAEVVAQVIASALAFQRIGNAATTALFSPEMVGEEDLQGWVPARESFDVAVARARLMLSSVPEINDAIGHLHVTCEEWRTAISVTNLRDRQPEVFREANEEARTASTASALRASREFKDAVERVVQAAAATM